MNERIKLKVKDVKPILRNLFPDYRGRTLNLYVQDSYHYRSIDSYWSGGYKKVVRILKFDGNLGQVSAPNELANPIIMEHGTQQINLDANTMVVILQYAGQSKWVDFYIGENSKFLPGLNVKLLEAA